MLDKETLIENIKEKKLELKSDFDKILNIIHLAFDQAEKKYNYTIEQIEGETNEFISKNPLDRRHNPSFNFAEQLRILLHDAAQNIERSVSKNWITDSDQNFRKRNFVTESTREVGGDFNHGSEERTRTSANHRGVHENLESKIFEKLDIKKDEIDNFVKKLKNNISLINSKESIINLLIKNIDTIGTNPNISFNKKKDLIKTYLAIKEISPNLIFPEKTQNILEKLLKELLNEKKYQPENKNELLKLVNNLNIHLGDIDTSKITDMSELFKNSTRTDFSGIEKWDVSSVVNMRGMFSGCKFFNEDIETWDVSHVVDMAFMFSGCENFNQPLDKWEVSNSRNMAFMFSGCENFNQELNFWDVSRVENMHHMFEECHSFDQDISSWNTSNVENMAGMFWGCESFNQPLNDWNVSNVKDMSWMFLNCTSFNQDLDKWRVGNVLDMTFMFKGCKNFNADISDWNVGKVESMDFMFEGCHAFNQDISGWKHYSSYINDVVIEYFNRKKL
ncbi:BspA family leucine-rich repeat surface protein [Campylobacter sp. US12a]|uniref:BspA family leucine-rich repeat surface protein n=1 Tax=Campylobacter sp. US12a TaxID=2498116 RepID=UPI0010687F18|nr:BspA family leucine-rich repeat surface protein [Campylobacter sp. US12a]TEY03869.1 BspA family leucine-rich repeat surface protein [Campylobacter sp. US12a]